ncbi:uncharacterized protein LOC110854201 [Folsomia candida]|uniref:Uncharacterized protein n=1 Tax=Folsomia candida TaxID=158441 RepID=A0A226E0C4_FOLCA|nr:uncharacterized protein LOC110854201 [Folsomia candida]OXA50391.1 hypothetical protein Fcan01_15263 [Folsomia candida]
MENCRLLPPPPTININNIMIHPTCGSDLRKSTKVAAMIDSILSGFLIFCGIAVLNNMFVGIRDPEASAFPVGCMILFVVIMGAEMYLAFRLYRAAHERDIQRLTTWRKAAGAVMTISTVLILLIRHTISNVAPPAPPPPPTPPPSSPFPLLWFYVVYFIAAIFRMYMLWILWAFLGEFDPSENSRLIS